MQLWLDLQDSDLPSKIDSSEFSSAVDLRIGHDVHISEDYILNEEGKQIGAHFRIDDPDSQNKARSVIGSVEWLMVECSNWTMIPLENLVADADGTPTSIAVKIVDSAMISGAAFALDIGVDAIVLDDQIELWEIGSVCKSQRLERVLEYKQIEVSKGQLDLVPLKITSIEQGAVGDRVCVDFVNMLEEGEGLLVGSSSKVMALVHSETLASGYVPPRPFRVNAGAVHSYCMLKNGKTSYLSEISAGDELLVCNVEGSTRSMTVGRVKIEHRPMILLKMAYENAHTGTVFLQQAETVRLLTPDMTTIDITQLQTDDYVLGNIDSVSRHVGVAISAEVEER